MILVFGGSFNPPTIAHINIVKEILNKNKEISKIIIVPVSNKYPKKGLIDFKHRYNMLKIATKNTNSIEISDIENRTDTQLNTYETLDILKDKYPDEDIAFLLGADNLNYFVQWTNSEYILKNYYLFVVKREGFNVLNIIKNNKILFENKSKIKVIEVNKDLFTISSTKIRSNINDLSKIKLSIDDLVLNYIKQNNLYNIMGGVYDK